MTTYNTNNPVGSRDPRDLYDNAQIMDDYTNSTALTRIDRLGNVRKTWAGVEQDARVAVDSAIAAKDAAVGAAAAIGPIQFYDTKAAADAAVGSLPAGAVVEIAADESRGAARTRYRKSGTALQFVIAIDDWKIERVNIRDLGGRDDWDGTTGTDNKTAFETLKNRATAEHPLCVELPFTDTGIYDVSYWGFWWSNNLVFDPAPGVELRMPSNMIRVGPKARTTRPLRCVFTDQSTEYTLRPDVNWGEKNEYIGAGDVYRGRHAPINVATEQRSYIFSWPSGNFNSKTSGFTASVRGIAHDAVIDQPTCTLLPAIPGAEISASWGAFTSSTLMAVVRTTNCRYLFNHSVNNNTLSVIKRIDGQAHALTNIPFTRFGSHRAYWPARAHWTIRINSPRSFSVLYSGVVLHTERVTEGIITESGFGYITKTTVPVEINDWVRSYEKPAAGIGELSVLILGNSQTDGAVVGAWPYQMRDALDYAHGARVLALNNIAYAGDNSSQQVALLKSTTNPNSGNGFHTLSGQDALNSSNVAIIATLETNDIQGGIPVATTEANYAEMLDIISAKNIPALVVQAPIFYSKGIAGNRGQNTSNYERGGEYRQRIARLCAERGVPVLELPQCGPNMPQHIDAGLAAMNDNIHPDTAYSRVIGYEIARAVVGLMTCRQSSDIAESAIPASWASAPWDVSGATFAASGGSLKLSGLIDRGATGYVNGAVIMTLPRLLAPARTVTIPAATQSGGGSFAMAYMQINAAGEVRIYASTPIEQYVYMSAASWTLNWGA